MGADAAAGLRHLGDFDLSRWEANRGAPQAEERAAAADGSLQLTSGVFHIVCSRQSVSRTPDKSI